MSAEFIKCEWNSQTVCLVYSKSVARRSQVLRPGRQWRGSNPRQKGTCRSQGGLANHVPPAPPIECTPSLEEIDNRESFLRARFPNPRTGDEIKYVRKFSVLGPRVSVITSDAESVWVLLIETIKTSVSDNNHNLVTRCAGIAVFSL
ncbi:hypothetical protein PoB_000789100 [Plakobranchus ocellatus]|uniref:Uncharacterized protein n=1 Tax=Plakobranchus ocellatus TaxID=259542 RepID=A0AAV3YG97_9GAST|nr:hypothetical protein PoB_000789100 [Plakobranchus ocellatus]